MEQGSAVPQETALSAAPQPSGGQLSLSEDAIREVEELRRRLDVLGSLLAPGLGALERPAIPAHLEPDLDVYENDYEFLIQAAIPGAAPEEIQIEATAHTITLTAETMRARQPNPPADAAGAKRHRRSRHADHDRFHFVYTLHALIVPAAVRAVFRNGIVEIHLPKAAPAAQAVAVPVALAEGGMAHGRGTDGLGPRPITAVARVISEGNPAYKLGHAYTSNAGEDHTAKAQSIGEQMAPGRAAVRSDRARAGDAPDPTQG